MFQFSDYGLSVDVILLGALAAILILLILCLILIGKNSSLRKRLPIWIISMAKSKKSMNIWL